jgi:RNA polymerase sigma-70 factor, ECF subfamily
MVAELAGGPLASMVEVSTTSADSTPSTGGDADTDAMRRLARGEVNALGELYDRHHSAIRRFATRMSGSSDDADDIVHATFINALKNAGSFEPGRSCRAWLLGIAAHLLRRERTQGARWARLLAAFRAPEPAWTRDPEGALSAREGLGRVERALLRLPEPKRVVLVMAEVEGLGGAEIAHALGIPLNTVWTRLHHARRELARALEAVERS